MQIIYSWVSECDLVRFVAPFYKRVWVSFKVLPENGPASHGFSIDNNDLVIKFCLTRRAMDKPVYTVHTVWLKMGKTYRYGLCHCRGLK